MELSYRFSAELWEWTGDAPWVFVTVPVDDADEIDELVPHKRGFGSVKVAATIGTTAWSTSIFPDKARQSYVLPVKRAVRQREGLDVGDTADVAITVVFDV